MIECQRSAMRKLAFRCVAGLLMVKAVDAGAIPTHIAEAVANPDRPYTDRQRDARRKPAEVIAFAGIESGDKVADFMPGDGYFTRILCKAVGDSGHIYAIAIPRSPPAAPPSQTCPNVTATELKSERRSAPQLWSSDDDPGVVYEYLTLSPPAENFAAPEPLDFIWSSGSYHELHSERSGAPNMRIVIKALLSALKPGGVLVVEDHAAARGTGVRDIDSLHRIEAGKVKTEVIAAGFVFVAESRVLRNSRDPHTGNAHELPDNTDRFLLKFRKP
jgi:predicted methyltransferase